MERNSESVNLSASTFFFAHFVLEPVVEVDTSQKQGTCTFS